jgi:hypothetical protein
MEIIDPSEQQNTLRMKKVTLESLVNKDRRKYFHLNTLDNFIYHFGDILNVDDRQWIYKTLQNYINEAQGLSQKITIDSSKAIYEDYLSKVATYYDKHLGFTMYVYLWVIIGMYLAALLIITYITNIYIEIVVSSALFIYHMTYLHEKHKQKKLFGTFY